MKSNYLATAYFISGFLTSFSLMFQGTEPYINLATQDGTFKNIQTQRSQYR